MNVILLIIANISMLMAFYNIWSFDKQTDNDEFEYYVGKMPGLRNAVLAIIWAWFLLSAAAVVVIIFFT